MDRQIPKTPSKITLLLLFTLLLKIQQFANVHQTLTNTHTKLYVRPNCLNPNTKKTKCYFIPKKNEIRTGAKRGKFTRKNIEGATDKQVYQLTQKPPVFFLVFSGSGDVKWFFCRFSFSETNEIEICKFKSVMYSIFAKHVPY